MQNKKDPTRSFLNRFFNSWWYTVFISLLTIALFIVIAIDLIAITVVGRSMWLEAIK